MQQAKTCFYIKVSCTTCSQTLPHKVSRKAFRIILELTKNDITQLFVKIYSLPASCPQVKVLHTF